MAEPGGPEDQKPQSDEARSAFSQPAGVGRSASPSEEDHPTSEFALPAGLTPEPQGPGGGSGTGSASGSGTGSGGGSGSDTIGSAFAPPRTYSARDSPAFTPAHGIPMIRLTKEAPWQDRMRTMLRMPVAERPAPEPVQKHDDAGPAVPRVLDLTLRIGELLLAGGEGAEDVEAAMFAVTRSYGLDRCEPTVTFTLLSISHQPSLVDDPVTASRTVRRRAPTTPGWPRSSGSSTTSPRRRARSPSRRPTGASRRSAGTGIRTPAGSSRWPPAGWRARHRCWSAAGSWSS